MIPIPFIRSTHCLAVIVGLLISTASAQTTICQQTFSPGAGTAVLNGTSPTIGASNWVASTSRFEADGDILEGPGSATLAFTPVDGFVYTLDASFRNMAGTAAAGAPEQDWVAVGFAKGAPVGSTTSDRFVNANVIGKAWMLFRGANTAGTLDNVAHLGSATVGNSSFANWSDATLGTTYGGGMDMRVVLDTTGGTGNWTATWYAKLPASGSFTVVRSTTTLVSEDINSVGVAISNPGIDGDLTYFSLTSLGSADISLLHHWKLDGDATDSVGSADGAEEGGAGYATGKFGQAVSLDGVDDYISTATAGNGVLPSTNYTLMAWVYWEGANSSRGYIAGGQNFGSNGEVFTMSKSVDGTDRILFLNLLPNGGQGNSLIESPDSTISTGTWHHVAYTVDSANGTTLYLDGLSVGTNPTRTTHTASTTVFNIGNNPQTGVPNPFDGLIDDVAVFSGVLDVNQINNAKNNGADKAISEMPGIATIEFDVSGNVVLTLDGPADGLTVQQSGDLTGFSDIPATVSGNTLTIDAADVDPNADGKDFYRVRN